MVKLPDVTKGKALAAGLVGIVGPKVVEYLQDPQRIEQPRQFVEKLGPALRPRTPDARLAAKILALREHLDGLTPHDAEYPKREHWQPRLVALDKKRALVMGAYSGRERSRQLKHISKHVDELLLELLGYSDQPVASQE